MASDSENQTARELDELFARGARIRDDTNAAGDARDQDRIDTVIAEAARMRAQQAELRLDSLLRDAGAYGVTVNEVAAWAGITREAAQQILDTDAGGMLPVQRGPDGRWIRRQ